MPTPPPIAATITDAAALAEELDRFKVLSRERLGDVLGEFPGGGALGLAEFLVARGELTPFQAERTLAGQARSLLLGPYRLLEPHHVGTFGPIFRAEKNGLPFAMRVLPLRSLWQAKQAKQLVRTLASLNNVPGVVPLVDADTAGGSHYLAWPLPAGVLLSERITERGPLAPEEAIPLLTRVAAALAACHTRQIVHGLLTPSSIGVDAHLRPQLLEVGAGLLLARNLESDDSLFDTMSSSLAVAGAFDYAAPEWVANPGSPQAASDQYSLGAIGLFVLTAESPQLADASSTLVRHKGIPRDLAAILARLLQPEAAARFSGMDEAWEALTALQAEPVEPLPDPDASKPSHTGSQATSVPGPSWTPPAEIRARPAERDSSEASVQFDLPDEDYDDAYLDAGDRETPPPAPWSTAVATPRTPPPLAPKVDLPNLEELPKLPAAALPPLSREEPHSGMWTEPRTSSAPETERPSGSVLWKKMKRKVLFWQTTGDTVQVSVFGPPHAAHSESPRLTVYLHTPSAAESVQTLARAFHHESILLGTGVVSTAVTRSTKLDVHVGIAHAAVTSPLGRFTWQGQPYRLTFEFVIPWEAPVGRTRGVVSIGRDEVRIGKAEFELTILDGKT
jgi:serine/threonine protein kinase